MSVTNARQRAENDIVGARRELVAKLRVRGLTTREIAVAVFEAGYTNKEGYALSHQTIVSDLKILRVRWEKNANVDVGEHRARQLAEIQHLKRKAWSDQDGSLALRAIETEMKLTGTIAAQKIQIDLPPEVGPLLASLLKVLQRMGLSPGDAFNLLLERADSMQDASEWTSLMQRGPGRIEYIEIASTERVSDGKS